MFVKLEGEIEALVYSSEIDKTQALVRCFSGFLSARCARWRFLVANLGAKANTVKVHFGTNAMPAIEPKAMIRPLPRSSMAGSTALMI